MDLAEQLGAELTAIRQKIGRTECMDQFTADSLDLLRKITAAQRALKQLAIAQAVWLQAQLAQRGSDN